jgi:hypothetical protein
MKLNKKWGLILLAVWLIASGVLSLLNIGISGVLAQVFNIVAIAAGVLILIDR